MPAPPVSRQARQFPVSPTLRQPAKERGPRATRTVGLILGATKDIFLTRGYAGTTVDEIARVAGISRASFYTYFPSKRDVLLALGAESAHAAEVMVGYVRAIELPWSDAAIEDFVVKSFAVLDDHASFGIAWTQAAYEDEVIHKAGMKRHLRDCAKMGKAMGDLRGRPFADPAAHGLVIFSALERAWTYRQLYAGTISDGALERQIAEVICATLRDPAPARPVAPRRP
ncbi:TetR/AcrR family transcriptional regulator [Acidiferrimicrobium sp. IK]|uniref:TetR/AcrR family transcriptional regulator n=1 Tax=Acidiferrimicrobium sp. IK TaxID=2871700 RepID=UPI0021CB66A2|nr:TetR/AcrR family transcriptional regulator [Acidiferrimicrobium sp. IK]MCU4183490.1 TetR/AcrR family transcriptional regulator [Acidiferrimicrobium sp. IK]